MASANSQFLPKRMADAYFTGAFKTMLVDAVPTDADMDTKQFRSDVTNEVAPSGSYAAGGASVSVVSVVSDPANNRIVVTFSAPAAFTGATISAAGRWIYKDKGSAGADELCHFIDFGGMKTSTNGTFTVTVGLPHYINR